MRGAEFALLEVQMTSLATITRTYTPEEFLDVEDAHRFELIDGYLVERNMSGLSSQVAGRFIARLVNHAESGAGGVVTVPDGGFRIFGPEHPDWVRFPDVAYFSKDRIPHDRLGEGWTDVTPDVVVEVVSPNDTVADVEDKAQIWLDAGVPTVWVAWPEQGRVVVHKPSSVRTVVQGDDLLTDTLLPRFSVPASTFFP
jgi:Uma2 family endonuclease